MRRAPGILAALLLALALLAGAAPAGGPPRFDPATVPAAPDYARDAAWLALPDDPDAHPVDVFWVYPTVLHDQSHWLMDTAASDALPAAASTLANQAAVFSGQANLYAPKYRQMNLAALTLPEAERNALLGYGEDDVWRAFSYYLAHYNHGRPFILAGHSQGSDVLAALFLSKWGSFGFEDRLVAAYLIGWSVTQADLDANPRLALCAAPDQTGCFITYNTVAAGHQQDAPTILPGALSVNPLSWTTDGRLAPATLNLGARLGGPDGEFRTLPGFTSAQIVGAGLVVAPSDPALVELHSAAFPAGVYHAFDYALFFENLRENAARRIRAWLERQ
ncbi:DUF3089 domain-containing protein [Pseudodesulfovibrio sp.]|uniref:DUF3089 domain-containing protein n=1 Tax=Pseudodesulfovibrio sp. TaxID=2035812 RepID=UPI00260DD37A|nr:DUF3089 domain-containing protein [Pseudodesulfovibrio sp.]MDD3313676.1 DUF3089 domain-containing protein [Pseudodesulfovibrio sp.]